MGQSASAGEGGHGVVVGVGRDFVSAVFVLGVDQECILEPGYEFALERIADVSTLADVDGWNAMLGVRRNEPPGRRSRGPSPR